MPDKLREQAMEDAIKKLLTDPAFIGTLGKVQTLPEDEEGFIVMADLQYRTDMKDLTVAGLVSALAARMTDDLDELRLHGDTASEDSFLSLMDGSAKTGKTTKLSARVTAVTFNSGGGVKTIVVACMVQAN